MEDVIVNVYILSYKDIKIPLFDYDDINVINLLEQRDINVAPRSVNVHYFTSIGTPVKYIPEGSTIEYTTMNLEDALKLSGIQIPLMNLLIKLAKKG